MSVHLYVSTGQTVTQDDLTGMGHRVSPGPVQHRVSGIPASILLTQQPYPEPSSERQAGMRVTAQWIWSGSYSGELGGSISVLTSVPQHVARSLHCREWCRELSRGCCHLALVGTVLQRAELKASQRSCPFTARVSPAARLKV